MTELSFEKQFVHTMICQQLESLDIDNAKKLLVDLHLLYLGQQSMLSMLIKQGSFI